MKSRPLRRSLPSFATASSALVWLLLAVLVGASAGAAAQSPPVVTAESARVYWQPPGADALTQIPIGASQQVAPGSLIVVDGLGRAALRLGPDVLVTIYPNSRVRIAPASPAADLAVEAGALFINTSETARPLRVAAGSALVQPAGRVFVYFNPRDLSAWAVVKSGAATVTAGSKAVALASREQTWVVGDDPPPAPQPANREAVGVRFYLIDDLTNRALRESDLLGSGFPWRPVALAAAALLVVAAAFLLARRVVTRRHAAAHGRHRPASPALPRPGELTIGRAAGNQLVLNDPRISGHHARIVALEGTTFIEDLGSRNGTFVNGALLTRSVLEDGDIVGLGGPQFIFHPDPIRLDPLPEEQAAASSHVREAVWVEVLEPGDPAQRNAVAVERFTIGRHPDNNLVLHGPTISRHHAAICRVADHWKIEDLDSAQGVWIEGARVREAPLTDGAHIRLGDAQLVFHLRERPSEEVAS